MCIRKVDMNLRICKCGLYNVSVIDVFGAHLGEFKIIKRSKIGLPLSFLCWLSCLIDSYHALSCLVLSYHVLLCPVFQLLPCLDLSLAAQPSYLHFLFCRPMSFLWSFWGLCYCCDISCILCCNCLFVCLFIFFYVLSYLFDISGTFLKFRTKILLYHHIA